MTATPPRHQTSLHDVHLAAGARMVDFAGWHMPLDYGGIVREHNAVREAAGLFDLGHMGQLAVEGDGATDFLQYVTTNDVTRLASGQVQYSALAYADGTAVDDLLVYRRDRERYMLVVNAVNTDKDRRWLEQHTAPGVRIRNLFPDRALLAVQGPRSEALLQTLTDTDLHRIAGFRFVQTTIASVHGILSRTGYTGEDGFEFYCPQHGAVSLWRALVEAGTEFGLRTAGLGARNTLRLEAGLLLYGNDLDNTTTLIEAGLGWIVRAAKGEFVGRDALVAQQNSGPSRKLVGFEMLSREVARDAYPIYRDGRPIGRVSSGAPSITLKKNIGLAYLPVDCAVPGTEIEIQVRSRPSPARVVATPFYRRSQRS